jgi:hypothetical protein
MEQQQQPSATRQRTVRSEEQILAILDEYDKSGYSVKEYCEVSDINEATFYSWIKKYRNKPEDDVKGFASIEVVPTFVDRGPQLFAEIGNIRLYKEVSAEYLKTLLS